MSSFYESIDQNQSIPALVSVHVVGSRNPAFRRIRRRLLSEGVNVTLVTGDLALKNSSSTVDGGVHLQYLSDDLLEDHNRVNESTSTLVNSLSKFGPGDLAALIRSHNYSGVISDPFLPWVADVAAECGLPCALLWTQSCTVFQMLYSSYNRLNEFATEPNVVDMCANFDLPSNSMGSYDETLKEVVFSNMHKYKWVLGDTFMELEKDVIKAVNDAGVLFWPVGPILPTTPSEEEDILDADLHGGTPYQSVDESNYLKWLDKQQQPASVVYISFGTLLSPSPKQIESIAIGLKISKRPFLWQVKLPENLDTEEIKILKEIKEQGLIVRWSPRTAVLSHPSVGCFVTHGGWNSLIEAIAAGVPMVACPQGSEESTNVKLVTDVWSIGVKLNKNAEGIFDGEEMERCVEEIMTGPRSEEFKTNAVEFKRLAREAVAEGGSSDQNLNLFVEAISSRSCS